MAKGKRFQSIAEATSAVSGDGTKTAGHPFIGLFVVANNLDTANDTLSVKGEVSIDDSHYTSINVGTTGQTDTLSLSASDFEQSDSDSTVYTAFKSVHSVPVEYVRANIDDFVDNADSDLSVDVYLFLGGWTAPGKSYNERTDTPTSY